jgi:hypothetical protein
VSRPPAVSAARGSNGLRVHPNLHGGEQGQRGLGQAGAKVFMGCDSSHAGALRPTFRGTSPSSPRRVVPGHGDATWALLPSLARPPCTVDAERTLVKRLKQNAFRFLDTVPIDEWAWLFLMQHHGVPMRLLDWTESPLVGLWFAVSNPKRDDDDGCLWVLEPFKLNEIARFRPYAKDIPFFGEDEELAPYLPTRVTVGSAANTPAAAIGSRQFARVAAQFGVFTITHREQADLADLDGGSCVKKFRVPVLINNPEVEIGGLTYAVESRHGIMPICMRPVHVDMSHKRYSPTPSGHHASRHLPGEGVVEVSLVGKV